MNLSQPPVSPLGQFLRARRDEIVDEWKRAARHLPDARPLSEPALVDHIPHVLESIAVAVDVAAAGGPLRPPVADADQHVYGRLGQGYDLPQVVAELALLRDCVIRLWDRPLDVPESRMLHRAIDEVIVESVGRFTQAKERSLRALDQVSAATVRSRGVDDFLRRFVQVLLTTTPSIDTAAIFLREGDRLVLRAAAGLEKELEKGFSLGIGEGFAGRVMALGKPLTLHAASSNGIVVSPVIKSRGVQALYGTPLVIDDRRVGVAVMGSVKAHEFSTQDRTLFEAMAVRVADALGQQVLYDEAERAIRNRDEVLAVVSHDLKNPLAAIVTGATLLVRSVPDRGVGRAVRERAQAILRAASRLDRMSRDLVDFAAIRSGRLSVKPVPTDLAQIVSEALDAAQPLAAERGVRLSAEGPIPLRPVLADKDRIVQLLGNLLGNAIKATDAGGEVAVSVSAREREVEVSVRDTGRGIPPEDLPRVFERYWRGSKASYTGTGLGLAISRGIVEAHAGRIWAESDGDGAGAEFRFTLPFASPD